MDQLAQLYAQISQGNLRIKRREDLEHLAYNSFRPTFDGLQLEPKPIPRYLICQRPLLQEGLFTKSKEFSYPDPREFIVFIDDESQTPGLTALHEAGHIFSYHFVPNLDEIMLRSKPQQQKQLRMFQEQFAEGYAIAAAKNANMLVYPHQVDDAHKQFVDADLEKLYIYMMKRLEILTSFA